VDYLQHYRCRRVRIEDLRCGLGCQSVQDLHRDGQSHTFMQSHHSEELEVEYVETVLARISNGNLFQQRFT